MEEYQNAILGNVISTPVKAEQSMQQVHDKYANTLNVVHNKLTQMLHQQGKQL